jgi:HNH endonuclease
VYALQMRYPPPWRSNVNQQPDGCWLWQGRVSPEGHGQFTRGGKTLRVHRVAWEETNGPLPDGRLVAHSCGVPACCNPAHLFLTTTADLRRSEAIPWRDRLNKQSGEGCWVWTGSVNKDGYGQIRVNRRTERVHRLAWQEINGPIPPGMHVCHSCDTPACCNPAHLFIGTQSDNVSDMVAKGRFRGGAYLNAMKTHCPQGHAYTPENTMTYNGCRSCRACMNARSGRYHREELRR